MELEKYSLIKSDDRKRYKFYNDGPKRRIIKVVYYKKASDWGDNVYNLSFGDLDEQRWEADFDIRSNNGNSNKILVAVALTLIDFLRHNPDALVFVKGSTASRTRLYQMKISVNLKEIQRFLDIEAFDNDGWKPFQRGKNYEAFLAKNKLNTKFV